MSNKSIKKIFAITDFIDNARWEPQQSNYNLINYYKEGLSSNVQILTHWICYITDRQMPFEQIWDVGGFVFSNLLDKIEQNKDDPEIIDKLLDPSSPSSFFVSRSHYGKFNSNFNFEKDDHEKFLFVAESLVHKNEKLKKYGFTEEVRPKFISRFYTTDYFSILSTLLLLKGFDFQLSKVIVPVLRRERDDLIRKVLFSLYLLSYYEIGQLAREDIKNYQVIKSRAIIRNSKVLEIISSPTKFDTEFKKFIKTKQIFKQKRAWCSLRDYCKSGFKEAFINILVEEDHEIYTNLFTIDKRIKTEHLKDFELPGDVWNNNSIFRNCLFPSTDQKQSSLALIVRELYTNEIIDIGYPEQFDITFDFVPRMCEKADNCRICPYGKLADKGQDFNKLCIQDETKFCPVVLFGCNYYMVCKGKTCKLVNLFS